MSVKSLRKPIISQSLRQSIAPTKRLIEKPNPLLLMQEMSDFSQDKPYEVKDPFNS